jgi:hypothetical protein
MARTESDREDLLREATALVERAELQVAGESECIVVGFRSGGAASFFFGVDPVYQFTTAGQLRRAYVGGRLLKAEGGRLAALVRERTEAAVSLVRTDLTSAEQAELLATAHTRLNALAAAIDSGEIQLIGAVPGGANIVSRIGQWLASLPAEIAVAAAPNVR